MPRWVLLVALLSVVTVGAVAAACDDDDGSAPSPTSTLSETAPLATDTPAATAEATPPPFEGSRDPVVVVNDTGPVALLVDVRAAEHEGYDRIVFEFEDALPGYRVEYVDQAIACGIGEAVDVEGNALLQVKMQPANAHNDLATPTFGSQEITPGLPSILEALQTCDFEADTTWVAGLAEEADFAVTTLTDPFRLVVDIAHPD